MAMKMGKTGTKTKTKGEMKTGLEGLNVILSRLNLDKPRMSIIFDPKWQPFVGQVEFEGHRLQSKGPFLKVVRDCLLYTSPSPRDRTRSRMPSSA